MKAPRTLVDQNQRLALSKDQTIGAGNFLSYAIQHSPHPEDSLLYLEKPFYPPYGSLVNELSLQDLNLAAQFYAGWYQSQNVQAKDPVAVYLEDSVEYLIHYLALNLLGAIPVLINDNMSADIAVAHAVRVGAVGMFVDEEHSKLIEPYVTAGQFSFIATNNQISVPATSLLTRTQVYRHADDDNIMIAHSSGTTGIPKAVPLEHQKFFYGIRYRLSVPIPTGGERILSSLPHSHNCAIAYIALALLSGTPVYITSNHQGASVLQRIDQWQPSMVVSFPQTYVEMAEQNLQDFDLSSVALWFNGGDAAHEPHIRKLIAQGHIPGQKPRVTGSIFVDGMGSSEMGFSLFRNVHTPKTDQYRRCVGKPLDWVDATVLLDNGNKARPGEIGKLGVKAPSVTTGYWNDSNLTARSKLAGYFLTGDLAYYDETGNFFHVDRIPDAIPTAAGTVYSLWTEETILRKFPCISDCSVYAASLQNSEFKDAVLAARLHNGTNLYPEELLAEINRHLADERMPPLADLQIVSASDVPLGTTGKVLKRALRTNRQFTDYTS